MWLTTDLHVRCGWLINTRLLDVRQANSVWLFQWLVQCLNLVIDSVLISVIVCPSYALICYIYWLINDRRNHQLTWLINWLADWQTADWGEDYLSHFICLLTSPFKKYYLFDLSNWITDYLLIFYLKWNELAFNKHGQVIPHKQKYKQTNNELMVDLNLIFEKYISYLL